MAKKIVAMKDLPQGHVLTRTDLAFKSPGDGLAPYEVERLIGRKLVKALKEDEGLKIEFVQ